MVQVLHKAGASLNSLTNWGISPLSLAIKAKSFSCVQYLIDNKADIMKLKI